MNTLFVIFAQWILRSAVVQDMIWKGTSRPLPKHVTRSKVKTATPSVLSLFNKTSHTMTINQKTTNAELQFVNFLVEHNLPIAIADHAGDLFCKMFPDSEIASQFKCGRTKARRLVGAIAKEKTEEITESLR